jgi:drug/metabolite transporter (DMT)-like permease
MTTQTSHPSHTGRGFAFALTAALMLSITTILVRYTTETYKIPALVLAFWRDVFMALTLALILGIFRPKLLRVAPRFLPYLAMYGLVFALFNAFWIQSVVLNGAAVATVLSQCSAAFTVIFGRWLLKEPLNWAKILVVIFSLGGCVLVAGLLDKASWQTNTVGILIGITAGLAYAGYTLMGRSAALQGLNPMTTILYIFSFASMFLFIINALPGEVMPGGAVRFMDLFWLGKSVAGWGILFLLSAGPTLAGFGLLNLSLVYLPSSISNLVMTSEPVITAFTAFIFLQEQLTGIQIIGSLVILLGVVLLRLNERWSARTASPVPENL